MGIERGHSDIGVSQSCINLFKGWAGEKGETATTANTDFEKVLVFQQSYRDNFHSKPTTNQCIFRYPTCNRSKSFSFLRKLLMDLAQHLGGEFTALWILSEASWAFTASSVLVQNSSISGNLRLLRSSTMKSSWYFSRHQAGPPADGVDFC